MCSAPCITRLHRACTYSLTMLPLPSQYSLHFAHSTPLHPPYFKILARTPNVLEVCTGSLSCSDSCRLCTSTTSQYSLHFPLWPGSCSVCALCTGAVTAVYVFHLTLQFQFGQIWSHLPFNDSFFNLALAALVSLVLLTLARWSLT